MKPFAKSLTVTIECEAGSCGGETAAALARMLGLPCYDKEILTAAAAISGIPERLLRRYEERPVRAAFDFAAENEAGIRLPMTRDIVAAQMAACRGLSAKGGCILLNHHAAAALSGADGHIAVFVHAGFDSRAKSMAARSGCPPAEARRALARLDRSRTRYFRTWSKRWGQAAGYQLSVDATDTAPEALAARIAAFLATSAGNARAELPLAI